MKKFLPILIIVVSIVISVLLQYELIEFYNKEYRQVNSIDELNNSAKDTILEIRITPDLFFYAEDQGKTSSRYFLTYEFGNVLLVNSIEDSSSYDDAIDIKGTVREIKSNDPIYKSIIALQNETPTIELGEGIEESLLEGVVIDWQIEFPESILLFEQVKPPVYPNTRFLFSVILIGGSIITAIAISIHNREE